VPALAIRGGWNRDLGLKSVELSDKGAYRQIYLTYRKQFPRLVAVQAVAQLIRTGLPDSVKVNVIEPM